MITRIIHAEIHPVSSPALHDATIEIEDGKIASVGRPEKTEPDEIIDAKGAVITPGFIDAHTHLGMWEDSLNFEGDDGNEDTDPCTPQLRAIDAINPRDRCFREAREAGVTSVVTGPGSANPIGGQMCAVKTGGSAEIIDEMVIKAPISMKMALGENPKSVYHGKNQAPVTRMATAALIREQLAQAREYARLKAKAEQDKEADPPDFDAKNEALLPVLRGELPVHFHAHRLDDMYTAMRIAKEFQLRFVIVHGTSAHLAAEYFAQTHTDIFSGPFLCDRSKPELYDLTPKNPGILHRAGVRVAIVTDHPVIPLPYLPLCAGLAVREGMPYEAALAAITLNPAKIIGIDDRVGSLEPGKDADLAVFDGDPLTVAAKPLAVMINGVWVKREM